MILGPAGRSASDAQLTEVLRSQLDSRQMKPEDYPDPLDGLEKFTSPVVLEREMRSLDNRPALFSRARMGYSAGDISVRVESLTYATFVDGRLYQVSASASVDQIAQLRPALERSLRTFVFEDW